MSETFRTSIDIAAAPEHVFDQHADQMVMRVQAAVRRALMGE